MKYAYYLLFNATNACQIHVIVHTKDDTDADRKGRHLLTPRRRYRHRHRRRKRRPEVSPIRSRGWISGHEDRAAVLGVVQLPGIPLLLTKVLKNSRKSDFGLNSAYIRKLGLGPGL